MLTIASLVIGVHLASVHFPQEPYQNNNNPGWYVKTQSGLTLGTYRNTINRDSFYLGQTFSHEPFSLTLGIISGYQKKEYEGKCTNGYVSKPGQPCYIGNTPGAIAPLIVPSVLLWDTMRLSLIPGLPGVKNSHNALHLSLEYKFK